MSTKLITDGSIDVPENAVKEYDITVVPPLVIIDGKEYRSGVDITLPEFFEKQRTASQLPKTSQPAPGQFVEAFEEALKEHERVLYIGVSAGLSGTMNSADQAAAMQPPGSVVTHDSMSISAEGGLQVIAAAKVLAQGGTLEEALAAAQKVQQQSQLYFTVDDLTYLIKGGRIGRVAGAVGSLLSIKPIITVHKADGKLAPHSRIRTFKATMSKLLELATDTVGAGKPGRFIVLTGEMKAEAQKFANDLRNTFDVRYLEILEIGPTLGAHTGPRALGLAVVAGDWE